jgi:hypothetical protein
MTMAQLLTGKRGPLILVEPGDTAYSIAENIAGDPERFPELVRVNPEKRTTMNGTFAELIPGERLAIPLTWAEFSRSKGVTAIAEEAMGYGDAGALLPLGWTTGDVEIANELARLWGATGDDLFVTWYEESGLRPHEVTKLGDLAPDGYHSYVYAGLIAGLSDVWDKAKNRRVFVIDESFGWPAGTWKKIVTQTPVATQLQAIAQIWDRLFKSYLRNETISQFAERQGVSVAAVIHALNFLPATVAGLKTRNSALTQAPHIFYTSNKGLDVNRDGKISLLDLDAHGKIKLAELAKSGLGQILMASRAAAKQPEKESLAAMFAPISSSWLSLTGKAPIVKIGYAPETRAAAGFGGVLLFLALVGGGYAYYRYGR